MQIVHAPGLQQCRHTMCETCTLSLTKRRREKIMFFFSEWNHTTSRAILNRRLWSSTWLFLWSILNRLPLSKQTDFNFSRMLWTLFLYKRSIMKILFVSIPAREQEFQPLLYLEYDSWEKKWVIRRQTGRYLHNVTFSITLEEIRWQWQAFLVNNMRPWTARHLDASIFSLHKSAVSYLSKLISRFY